MIKNVVVIDFGFISCSFRGGWNSQMFSTTIPFRGNLCKEIVSESLHLHILCFTDYVILIQTINSKTSKSTLLNDALATRNLTHKI